MFKKVAKRSIMMLTILLVFTITVVAGEKQEAGISPAFTKGKFAPPIKLTAVARIGEPKYLYNDTLNDNAHTRWALETLGIKIEYVMEPATPDAYKQKLQLMIASGEKLPDIVVCMQDPVTVGQLIDSGRFMPVEESYKKYAVSIYKAHAEKHPEIWYPFMKGGKKYGIPILEWAHNGENCLWIREDWLKALNLSAPKTIDELENVLHQFKYKNPDGLKPSEVFPFTFSFKDGAKTWLSSMDWFFGAYGTVPMQWNLQPNGTLAYGSIHPGAKKALMKLKEWMDKGYIHSDVAMWDAYKATEIFQQGKAGVIGGANWACDWPLLGVKSAAPNAVVRPYPLPAGPGGHIGGAADRTGANGVILINKDFKYPEAFWMYYNYLLEYYADPKPGGPFEYGFAKGYDWDIVDGVPTNDPKVLKEKKRIDYDPSYFNFLTQMPGNPARIPYQYFDALIKLADGQKPVTPFEKRISKQRCQETWLAAKVIMSQSKYLKPNYFNGAPTKTMVDRWELLFTSELETYSKLLYGKIAPAEFDKWVSNWKKNGGNQITSEVNSWYRSVKKK